MSSSLLLVDYSDDEPTFTSETLATTQGEPSPPPSPIADHHHQFYSPPSPSSILLENPQTSNPISSPPKTMPSSKSPQIHTTPSSTPVPQCPRKHIIVKQEAIRTPRTRQSSQAHL